MQSAIQFLTACMVTTETCYIKKNHKMFTNTERFYFIIKLKDLQF